VASRHLALTIILATTALAATAALGQPRKPLAALAEKVCQLGQTAKETWPLEQLGLDAPFRVVEEPERSGIMAPASVCRNAPERADTPFLGLHRFVDATAPGESVFDDYFIISGSGDLIEGVRLDLSAKVATRLNIAEPAWQEEARAVESYWLDKYGLQGR
jgi:hypothetical protein